MEYGAIDLHTRRSQIRIVTADGSRSSSRDGWIRGERTWRRSLRDDRAYAS